MTTSNSALVTKGNRSGDTVPEPWYTMCIEKGMVDPLTGVPSVAGISRASGISAMTIARILRRDYGNRGPSPAIVRQFADAFGVEPAFVAEFIGIGGIAELPWQRPESADYLSDSDGRLVTALINRLTQDARRKAGVGDEVVEVAPVKKARATKVARRPAKETAAATRSRKRR